MNRKSSLIEAIQNQILHTEKMLEGLRSKPKSPVIDRLINSKIEDLAAYKNDLEKLLK